jgi:predicted DCC family thiol-disulfide oxidoreductase YuxK
MSALIAQVGAGAQGRHLVLYDGVCGLCSRLLQFVLARDHQRVFNFASLQGPTGRATIEDFGGNPDELTSFYVVENYRMPTARVIARSQAALFVADALGWPWKAVGVFRILPTGWLNRAYDLVAQHRYRIFGRYDVCLAPRPEYRDRFVD